MEVQVQRKRGDGEVQYWRRNLLVVVGSSK